MVSIRGRWNSACVKRQIESLPLEAELGTCRRPVSFTTLLLLGRFGQRKIKREGETARKELDATSCAQVNAPPLV